jgi:putative alpha-1,2-mannosidase
MTNKVLAEKVNKSEEGISSSLRKMYALFHIEVTSNKKVALMNKLSLISAKKAVINVQDAQDVQSE